MELLTLSGQCAAFDRSGGLWLLDAPTLRRLDLESGEVTRMPVAIAAESPRSLAVLDDGACIAVAERDRSIIVRDPRSAEESFDLPVTGVADVAFGPGGLLAMAHSEEGLLMVDSTTLEPVWAEDFIASQQPVIRFSPEGDRVAVNTCEAIMIFACSDGGRIARIERTNEALFTWAATSTMDACFLTTDCGAKAYRAKPGEEDWALEELPSPVNRIVASIVIDGDLIGATADGRVLRLDDEELVEIAPVGTAKGVTRLEVDPTGRWLAAWTGQEISLLAIGTKEAT